jgi:hypothetical protein
VKGLEWAGEGEQVGWVAADRREMKGAPVHHMGLRSTTTPRRARYWPGSLSRLRSAPMPKALPHDYRQVRRGTELGGLWMGAGGQQP